MLLENKVAVVTGGSRGIGKAIVEKLAREGAKVVACGRQKKSLEKLSTDMKHEGVEIDFLTTDVSSESDVMALRDYVQEKYGAIHIVVNNAGVSNDESFIDMSMDMWEKVISINFKSVVMVTKAFLPLMLRNEEGAIVNISSGAGIRGLPGSCAYSATKAAVINLTQALGDEIKGSGVRCNVICPGPVETELLKESKQKEFILSSGGTLFQPETVAEMVLYLTSSMSKGINSQVFQIRGCNRW